jgi:hypothetical protein
VNLLFQKGVKESKICSSLSTEDRGNENVNNKTWRLRDLHSGMKIVCGFIQFLAADSEDNSSGVMK